MKRVLLAAAVAALAGCTAGSGASAPAYLPSSATRSTAAAAPHAAPMLTVNPHRVGAVESSLVLGANMATWYNVTQPGLADAFKTAGMTATRWPGGSLADIFHWKTNSLGTGQCDGSYVYPASTFDSFIAGIAQPAKLDVAVTVNYGSNPACNAGAAPSEAASWVRYANNQKHYGVIWWTVGNEEFGSWEMDLHSEPHDPSQYAANVANDFYPQMKAASSTPIKVGVDVDPSTPGWDPTVLSRATYDFVELHYYPEGNTVSDSYIVDDGAAGLTKAIDQLKNELKTAGHANTPIYVGELGSTYGTPGKQTMSITQALYAGQAIGSMLDAGVARSTWWLGYGGCDSDTAGGDFSSKLYGWQNFGGYMIFSDGTVQDGCSTTNVPTGTLLPTARAYQVAAHFVRAGEHMLGHSQTGLAGVRAYAATYDGGYALLLFNVDENDSVAVPVTIAGKASGSGGTIVTYDKTLYDASKENRWLGPTSARLAAWRGSFTVTLPPWSMAAVVTK